MDLHLLSLVPEDKAKYEADQNSHEESNGVVLGVPPVRPIVLPETSFALLKK